jgi:diadenylate cyclase
MNLMELIVPGIEIAIITMVHYMFLCFFWNTRAMDLVLGFMAFLGLFAISNTFNLPVIKTLMFYVVNVAAVAILVIFQPELRIALTKISIKGRKYREITEFDCFLESITQTVYRLAEKRIGALILLENQDSLEDYANQAVRLSSEFSPELLETIFSTSTPLHDGGVIIRGTTILSAATILPLADDSSQLGRTMGTRHRAALGISQVSDALIIVVSEQTGKVSIAREGIMTRGIKIDRFKGIIRSIFTSPQRQKKKSYNPITWMRQWRT